MKKARKILAISLSSLLATTMTTPVFAKGEPSSKEEVVYIVSNADGTVNNINVVNIFNGGNIIDYGDYSSVKMLTAADKITQHGDEITFHTGDEKVYYQGTMKQVEIPWNISVKYFLNGEEYSPQDIANKSGDLKIAISITKNTKCIGSYFDDYALQTTLTLDTNSCKNIVANGSTIANVGSKKQLTYTTLPNKGLEATIQANVKDFEMSAISINGIKLNLDIDVNDKELTQKVDEFMSATQKLDSSTRILYEGTNTLKIGGSDVEEGITALHSGIYDLDYGISSFQNGITSMQLGLDTLQSKSYSLTNGSSQVADSLKLIQKSLNSVSISAEEVQKLISASSELKKGIDTLSVSTTKLNDSVGYAQYKSMMLQNGLDIDQLKSENENGLLIIETQINSLKDAISKLENTPNCETEIMKLQTQIQSLESISQLLRANTGAMNGTMSYVNNLSVGMNRLAEGVLQLKENYEIFDAEVMELSNTLHGLVLKMSELAAGVNELVTNYEKLDTGLHEYTQGVSSIVYSYQQLMSGVSSLASGSKALVNGSDALSSGSAQLYDGIASLCEGASKLADGTSSFQSETATMNTELQNQIDGILSSIQGEKTETVSFVSEKNKDVESLQFVIQVKGIERVEQVSEHESTTENSKSIWEKFLSLFGFE